MGNNFLYRRITKGQDNVTGTLAEPEGAPEPRFALQSTISWMRALALLTDSDEFAHENLESLYKSVDKSTNLSDAAANTMFEQLLMSLHHLSSLKAIEDTSNKYDVFRMGIVTWYYGVYCAASAMIAACEGAQQQDHSGTANAWDRQIASRGFAPYPFNLRLTTMVEKDAKAEIEFIRDGQAFSLPNYPTEKSEAHGVCVSYLSGSREYFSWILRESLKRKELKKLGLSDFRTKVAKELRDSRLHGKSLGFINQAFRYRGKANYRDALFLSYDASNSIDRNDQYAIDLTLVLTAFLKMAGAYCSRRVGSKSWELYCDDLDENLVISTKPCDLWKRA